MSAKKYTGYYTYRVWLAFQAHFTRPKFDVRKYPAAKCNLTTYEQSRLRWAYEWLSNKYDASRIRSVMLANIVQGYTGAEKNETFWMLDRERVVRAWKDWSNRIKHFRNRTLTDDGYDLIMGGIASADERFEIYRQGFMSPEGFLISCRGTNDLNSLMANYGETDSFPNYSDTILFLQKYDLLLDLIPPVKEVIDEKESQGDRHPRQKG